MLYLQTFRIPAREDEENFFFSSGKAKRTCYTSRYPFGIFREREVPELFFEEITVFCGDNGSGKSTLLNVIAEKLGLERNTPCNRSDFFDDYVQLCDYVLEKPVPEDSRIITSDGVFDRVLDIRRLNEGIDDRRNRLIREYVETRYDENPEILRLDGFSDYERWKQVHDIKKRHGTQSQFLRSRVMRNIEERSNGESALAYFVDAIAGGGLYLLDEPENSLSPENQLALKDFIEECVREQECQFVISTHSPFLLSLQGACIYDLDRTPPAVSAWTQLPCVRTYRDFFVARGEEFS